MERDSLQPSQDDDGGDMSVLVKDLSTNGTFVNGILVGKDKVTKVI